MFDRLNKPLSVLILKTWTTDIFDTIISHTPENTLNYKKLYNNVLIIIYPQHCHSTYINLTHERPSTNCNSDVYIVFNSCATMTETRMN